MKYNQATLDKIERILKESEYIIRFEKGTFQSGYCILEEKKIVVLNKFLDTEGRINTLTDLLSKLYINTNLLSNELQQLYNSILKTNGASVVSGYDNQT